MKTLILTTNTNDYQVIENEDGTLTISTIHGLINNPGMFINNMGGTEGIMNKCIEINDSLQNYVANKKRGAEEKRAELKAEKLAKIEKLKDLNTPQSLYEAFCLENKMDTMQGWGLGDRYFLSKNPLSEKIISKIGSYTFAPYDNGAIILKANGKSYSNNRRYAKAGFISDLIND